MPRQDVETALSAGQRAAQSGIRELLARHEAKVIARMVTNYRNSKLTPEDAKVGIAVVSELRSIAGDVERDILAAQNAMRDLTQRSSQ